jgi:hypothetical protein
VNTLPILRYVPSWFPGAGWKRVAQEWREQKNKTIQDFFNKTKEQMVSEFALNGAQSNLIV